MIRTTSFIIIFSLISSITIMTSCNMFCKKGNGEIIAKSRDVSEFDEIVIDGQATVYIEQGTTPSLTIKIDSNLIDFIKTDVSGMKLKIKEEKCIEEITEFEIYIITPGLSKLEVQGSIKVKGESTIKSEKLYLNAGSSGEIILNLDVDDLETDANGSGEIKLSGRADQFDIELDGAGSLDAFRLEVKEADAEVKGAGTCKINVSEELYGDVTGSGKLYYKGNPKKVKTDVSGSGTIQAK